MEGAEIVVGEPQPAAQHGRRHRDRRLRHGLLVDELPEALSRSPSLKIDRSFVTDLATNPADAGIVRAIVEMAHGSRLNVIAEGVESKDQFRCLQQYGCDEMQGYWVASAADAGRRRSPPRGRAAPLDRAVTPGACPPFLR